MIYLLIFIFTLIFSSLFTGVVRNFAISKKLLPKARSRDSHKKPLPRIGGVAIFFAFIISSLIFFYFLDPNLTVSGAKWFSVDKRIFGIWLASFLIVLVMLIDDLRGLSAAIKLIAQIVASGVIVASGIGIDFIANPLGGIINLNSVYLPIPFFGTIYHISFWSDLLTLIWLVGMMNVINFIDGIDGLAAGTSAIAAFTLFILSVLVGQPAVAATAIIVAGAAIGFLFWNFYPAKIFMGDSGSMFLGLLLGVLPLISGGKLATAFLVLGFAIVDGLVVAGARIWRKQNPFTTPDKTHLHHRFLAAGFSVPQAVISMYIIAILFGWVALRSTTNHKIIASIILIFFIAVLIIVLNEVKKRRENVRK